MDLERDGNLIEAGVWIVLSVVLFVHAVRSEKRLRPTLFVLGFMLAIFGVSDLVEARTGAWWKPWWLFVWKAVCVITLLSGFLRYYQIQKSKPQMDTDRRPSVLDRCLSVCICDFNIFELTCFPEADQH